MNTSDNSEKIKMVEKLVVSKIETELVPWNSQEELVKRVTENLDWNRPEDPIPTKLTYARGPGGMAGYDIYAHDELHAIMNQLPKEHELNQEIIKQTKKNLIEITLKAPERLRGHIPKYLNSFWVGDVRHFEELFDVTQNTAYHVINNPVFTNTIPKEEDEIMFAVAKGMQGYIETKPNETLEFFNVLRDKELVLPHMLTGCIKLKNTNVIPTYFNLFNQANGQNTFTLNEIQRGVIFKFIGKRLKRAFPEYDFQKEINQSNPNLKKGLKEIFS